MAEWLHNLMTFCFRERKKCITSAEKLTDDDDDGGKI